ncbi:MAG: radical SAM protein [Lachnospiraceae bacterium]|nr:radical SAM protein [Lachnospiraceae bacterium]
MDINLFRQIKQTGSLNFPEVVQFELTNRCPLQCPQCYKGDQDAQEMDPETFSRLLDECLTKGTRKIILNGGEVSLYSSLAGILKIVNSYPSLYVNCYTSGIGFETSFLKGWDFSNDHKRLFISLNGSEERINRLSRDGYHHSLHAMSIMRRENLPYGINWVLRGDNIADFPNMIKLCTEYKAKWLFITRNKKTGSGLNRADVCSEQDKRLFLDVLSRACAAKDPEIIVESCFPELRYRMEGKKEGLNFYSGCGAGRYLCCITAEGKMMPCTHLYEPREYASVEAFWRELVQKKVTPSADDRCQDCKIKSKCRPCPVSEESRGQGGKVCWFKEE